MKFKKGQSGNPTGRPPGSKDKRTALREMLESHSEELINKALELAREGDSAALKMCIDRLMPPLRPQHEKILLEGISGTLTEQAQAIIQNMAEGKLAPDQATNMIQAISAMCSIQEVDELRRALDQLEMEVEQLKGSKVRAV